MSYEQLEANHVWTERGPGGLVGVKMFWRNSCLDSARSFLVELGYREFVLDCGDAAQVGIHAALRTALGLPEWFGPNWNAYYEAFEGGFGIEPTERIAFVIRNAHLLDDDSLHSVIDGAVTHDREFLFEGGRLAVLVQTTDCRTEIAPVGARDVRWNVREWLTSHRLESS